MCTESSLSQKNVSWLKSQAPSKAGKAPLNTMDGPLTIAGIQSIKMP